MLDKCLCLPLPFIFTSYIRKFFLYEICFLMFGVLQNKLYLCILLKSFKCHDAIEIFRAALMGSQRRQWHPTPVLLPGKSHGGRSLVSCGPWGRSVRHDWATSLSPFTFTHWRRKWQPTPVFLPGESQGQGSLVGCSLCDHTGWDTTEAT